MATGARPFTLDFIDQHVTALGALNIEHTSRLIDLLDAARYARAGVFLAGNGGSAATASHIASDLMKTTALNGRPPVRALCLSDCTPVLTAFANDVAFSEVFAGQLEVHASAGDVLIVVSASGRSPNILRALETARNRRISTVGLFGMGGGPAAALCDIALVVDSDDYGVIEDVHLVIGHLAAARLRDHSNRIPQRTVFLDRDGVLVPDLGVGATRSELNLLPGAGRAVGDLNRAGWAVVVVTSQAAVARGLLDEEAIAAQHRSLGSRIEAEGGHIDGFFHCPHHPDADVAAYRVRCDCRKPLPGLIFQAADSLGLDVAASVMVGDRMTDVEAGERAGCRLNILVESGKHLQPRVVTDAARLRTMPGARVPSLAAAVAVILGLGPAATLSS